ncbi:MAG: hypothetical protein GX142_01530 [Chloroflexi bacterium]|nr:hypothetical protein [Chloroflexota bacterium]
MKKVALVMAFLLIFTLTACSSKTEASEPKETKDNSGGNGFVYEPKMPVPKDLPVYPGAVLWSEVEGAWEGADSGNWMWLYNSEGSGNEIVEFFKTELEAMGFEIGTAHATQEEFGVSDVDFIVAVGFLDDGISDPTPDTPGRGYMITLNLEAWENRSAKAPVEPENPDPGYVYEPGRAIPEGLPVYPGAVLTFDTEVWSAEGTAWMWMYEGAGSAKEILEFFQAEFEKLGFEIEETFADDFEVFLHDTTETVHLGWSADESDDLSRLGYMITVNLDGWDNR